MISRRGLIASTAALAAVPLAACDPKGSVTAPAAPAGPKPAPPPGQAPAAAVTVTQPRSAWTLEAFHQAMAASGRPVTLSQARFDAIQARKPEALARIKTYLDGKFGAADPNVMAAFQAVPREYYHYLYSEGRAQPDQAYEANPKPWALGYGSALSDYLGQAYMTQLARPKAGDVTLEVGTGSGFQSSLLSRIVGHAYSIEIIEPPWARRSGGSSSRWATTTSPPAWATATSAGPR
jgi:protein-L-isoaspartate(D-aspartate) O-methyltransferase